jgi:hypothetical protein
MVSDAARRKSLRVVLVAALTVGVALLTACDAFGTPVTNRDPSFSAGFNRDGGAAGVAGRGGSGGFGGFGGAGAGGDADAATKEPLSNDAGAADAGAADAGAADAGDDDSGDADDASVCVPGDCCGLKCTPA